MPAITKETLVRDLKDGWSLEDIGRGMGWKPIPPFKRGTTQVLGHDGRWRAGGAVSGSTAYMDLTWTLQPVLEAA